MRGEGGGVRGRGVPVRVVGTWGEGGGMRGRGAGGEGEGYR